ncbi:hypothetical protein ACOME3_006001 [Neoechinorhynchus agilis]
MKRTRTAHLPNRMRASKAMRKEEVPKVKCRESQQTEIEQWVSDRISGRCSSALHINGPPGTGKTFVMKAIVRQLGNKAIYVNCMQRTRETFRLNDEIRRALDVKPAAKVIDYLTKMPILLVIDEIDQIVGNGKISRKGKNADRDFFINLLKISLQSKYRLALVGVSNALRNLANRFHSETGIKKFSTHFNTLTFPPYTCDEINQIIEQDVDELNNQNMAKCVRFDKSVLTWCSALVSNSTGDARNAIELARTAFSKAIAKGLQVVSLDNIIADQDEKQNLPPESTLSLPQRLVLKQLVSMVECRPGRLDVGTTDECYVTFQRNELTVQLGRMEYDGIIGCLCDMGLLNLDCLSRKSRGFGSIRSNSIRRSSMADIAIVKLSKHPDDLKSLLKNNKNP